MDKSVAGARFLNALQRVYPALVLSFGTVGEKVPEYCEAVFLELRFVQRFVVLVEEHQVHLHGVPLMVLGMLAAPVEVKSGEFELPFQRATSQD